MVGQESSYNIIKWISAVLPLQIPIIPVLQGRIHSQLGQGLSCSDIYYAVMAILFNLGLVIVLIN